VRVMGWRVYVGWMYLASDSMGVMCGGIVVGGG